MKLIRAVAPLVLLSLSSVPVLACIWDYDTLRDERRGLPGVAEVLSGRFEKRSQFFYADRIGRMQELLKAHPDNLEAIDNLAVALFRVGRGQEAIQTLLDKEKRFPDQYTTASNLATFYMLSGDNPRAIPLLEKALVINPNAHFGREKYQLQLARFLVRAASAKEYPLEDFLERNAFLIEEKGIEPDYRFIFSNWGGKPNLPAQEQEALEAIVGMVRFGTEQSSDLFFALGNLLNLGGKRHLAIRAYSRAIELNHPRKKEIELLVEATGGRLHQIETSIESKIAAEQAEGAAWAKKYMDYADDLIRSGKDPEDEANYQGFYAVNGPAIVPGSWALADFMPQTSEGLIAWGIGALALIGATVLAIRSRRRNRRPAAPAA